MEAQSAVTPTNQDPKISKFEFHGEGAEFFKIWFVNILLTVLTLGIYSAWAKVRTKRYFYTNTQVMGSAFDYLATPIQILKGRVIAFAILAVFLIASEINPIAGAVLPLVLFVLTPILIVWGTRFNARYSAYRNVRFNFDGKIKTAYLIFVLIPMIPVLIMFYPVVMSAINGVPAGQDMAQDIDAQYQMLAASGFGALLFLAIIPYVLFRQKTFIADNHKYGTARFNLNVTVGNFYGYFLKVIGINIVIAIVGAIAFIIAGFIGALIHEFVVFLLMGIVYAFMLGAFVGIAQVMLMQLIYNNLSLKSNQVQSNFDYSKFVLLVVTNTILTAITLGLFYPFAKVRTARYIASHMSFMYDDSFEKIHAEAVEEQGSLLEEMGDAFDVELGI